MLKVFTVFGTRPEAVKLAPVAKAIETEHSFEQSIVATAQHRQMLDQVLDLFEIEPDFDLDLMRPDQTLPELTARLIVSLSELFSVHRPDIVLVQGDTTTSFCGALAAFYNHIAVGHVEAGLRTFDKQAPWPEEMNRQLTGRLADLHFAPTQWSRENLLAERVSDESIEVTGNTVIDALFWVLGRLERSLRADDLTLRALFASNALNEPMADAHHEAVARVVNGERRLVLITGHRRESFGEGFERICEAICRLAQTYPDSEFIYPIHLNPNVQEPVRKTLGSVTNVHLLPPLDYLPFVYLMKLSTLILTDSGGIQEEAPSLGVPVLVMRETTERPEGVEAGTVELVGTSIEGIVSGTARLLDDEDHYKRMSRAVNPYGDGRASGRIVSRLRRFELERGD